MAGNNILIKQRLSKTRFIGRLLILLPFVRSVILNGSLASGNHKKSSDIDILIITKSGRIFTARFFVNFMAVILRIKRSKDENKNHAGKFCFNYFLTDKFLKIPTDRGEKMDQYCAENYSQSRLITGDEKLFIRYLKVNDKLFRAFSCHPRLDLGSSNVINSYVDSGSGSGMTKYLQKISEIILNGKLGSWLEIVLKKYQIKKINSDPRTKKYPNLIVVNDNEMRFHPPKIEFRG